MTTPTTPLWWWRVDYGSTSLLLTGDMEQKAEDDLVASGAPLDADILQVGHHGSETSTGYVFLNAVLPEVAVISVGAGNSYGHPSENTLSRLRDAGADVWRTDLAGTVTITSDGTNYTVSSEKYAAPSSRTPPSPTAAVSRAAPPRPSRPMWATSTPRSSTCPAAPTARPGQPGPVLQLRGGHPGGLHPCGNCLG